MEHTEVRLADHAHRLKTTFKKSSAKLLLRKVAQNKLLFLGIL